MEYLVWLLPLAVLFLVFRRGAGGG